MNKTVLVNIGRMPFYLEEDAYQKLDTYLKEIKEYFSTFDGKDEIIADIESRIAERLIENMASKDQVIVLKEVEEIIKSMGTVKDFETDETPKSKSTATKSEPSTPKKLMRDTDNAIIAGVCSGLAAYSGLDVTLIRILFVVFTLTGGPAVIVYIVLWLVMPEAKTVNDKLVMQGKPTTLSDIGNTVKTKFESVSKDNNVITRINKVFETLAKVFLAIIGVFMSIIGSIVGISLTIALGALLFLKDSPNVDTSLINFPSNPSEYALIVLAYLTVIIPTLFAIILGVSLAKRKYILHAFGTVVLLGIWVFSASIGTGLGIQKYPDLKARYEANLTSAVYEEKDFDSIKVANTHGVHLVINEGPEYKIQAQALSKYNKDLAITRNGSTLEIGTKAEPQICIFCITRTEVQITMPVLKAITVEDGSYVSINGFTSLDMLSVEVQDSSTVDIRKGSVNTLSIQVSDSSVLNASEFMAGEIKIEVTDSSRAEVWAVKKLEASVSDSSLLDYRGDPVVTKDVNQESRFRQIP